MKHDTSYAISIVANAFSATLLVALAVLTFLSFGDAIIEACDTVVTYYLKPF